MIAIISDVHGNYPALKSVMNEIDKSGCELILSLGDVAGYYCMINECIELLKSHSVINIMGNHDAYLVNNSRCPRSTSANICLDFQKECITQENLEWLKNSIPLWENEFISAVHGGWRDYQDEYIYDFDFYPTINKTIFISGHTHIQVRKSNFEKTYFNPGSVGQPRDQNNKAAFAFIYDDKSIELRRVDYDISYIDEEMKKNGFDRRYTIGLYYGERIGTVK